MKEMNCIVLEFLPNGYADRRQREPIAQALGANFFSLLEVVPRENVSLSQGEEAYIGDGKRDKIRFIRGQLEYRDLTNMSRNMLPERSKKPFASIMDIRERVKLFPDPVKTVVQRVLVELEGNEKYYLFAVRQQRRF